MPNSPLRIINLFLKVRKLFSQMTMLENREETSLDPENTLQESSYEVLFDAND
jgi:hypothetical protein